MHTVNLLHLYTNAHTIKKFLKIGKNHTHTQRKDKKKAGDAKKIF